VKKPLGFNRLESPRIPHLPPALEVHLDRRAARWADSRLNAFKLLRFIGRQFEFAVVVLRVTAAAAVHLHRHDRRDPVLHGRELRLSKSATQASIISQIY
jgi:hypothetical protein